MSNLSLANKALKYHELATDNAQRVMGNLKTSRDPRDLDALVQASKSMQMANWAADIAVTNQHGLLKKVMGEIR